MVGPISDPIMAADMGVAIEADITAAAMAEVVMVADTATAAVITGVVATAEGMVAVAGNWDLVRTRLSQTAPSHLQQPDVAHTWTPTKRPRLALVTKCNLPTNFGLTIHNSCG